MRRTANKLFIQTFAYLSVPLREAPNFERPFGDDQLKNGMRRTANKLFIQTFAYLSVPLREAPNAREIRNLNRTALVPNISGSRDDSRFC
jgi:hypothetical protein